MISASSWPKMPKMLMHMPMHKNLDILLKVRRNKSWKDFKKQYMNMTSALNWIQNIRMHT